MILRMLVIAVKLSILKLEFSELVAVESAEITFLYYELLLLGSSLPFRPRQLKMSNFERILFLPVTQVFYKIYVHLFYATLISALHF